MSAKPRRNYVTSVTWNLPSNVREAVDAFTDTYGGYKGSHACRWITEGIRAEAPEIFDEYLGQGDEADV